MMKLQSAVVSELDGCSPIDATASMYPSRQLDTYSFNVFTSASIEGGASQVLPLATVVAPLSCSIFRANSAEGRPKKI